MDPPLSGAPSPDDRPVGAGPGAAEEDIQREKLMLLGRMASNLAHEIRNPLATIVATSQSLLASWTLPGSAEEADGPARHGRAAAAVSQLREDLHLVVDEARRAGELVGGLLSFARRREDWGPVAIEEVVRRVVALCRHPFLVDDVQLVESFPVSVGQTVVLGSANQLQQVLLNLVVNARQSIAASRRPGLVRIEVQVSGEPGVVSVVVEDDGPGVPVHLREVVFEPYFTTRTDEGTGLGLYICRGIAQGHGGTLMIDDRSAGACFVLTLPRAALAPVVEPRRQPADAATREPLSLAVTTNSQPRPGGDGLVILLVDDEDGLRRVVARYLRKCGNRVEEASSGRAAVAAIGTVSFDAIVSDLRMPGFSGMELFEWVERERPDLAGHFVFTSGDTLSGETSAFLATAGRPILQKPFDLSALRALLTEVSGAAVPRLAARAGA